FPKDEKQASGTTLIHSQPSQVGQQPWLKIQSARWLNFESAPTFLEAVCPLLVNIVPTAKRPAIEAKIVKAAHEYNVFPFHPAVVLCVACLYGGGSTAAREVLKPHKRLNAYNVLSDLQVISYIRQIKAIAAESKSVQLEVHFHSMDEGLTKFIKCVHAESRLNATKDGVDGDVGYEPALFEELTHDEAIDVLHRLANA
ncbi:MAG: hypothetical protein ACOZE7_22495, partial [Pseudomonadota bacterium]